MVCPSVWAWRPERLARIAQSVDHVLCIFPFEPELLAAHGIAATYIGHPLAPLIPQQADQLAARHALGLDVHRPVVALLPGSRASEIKYLAQRFLKAAQLIRQRQADVQFVLPAMPHLREGLQQLINSFKLQHHVKLIEGQSHAALAACDVTLIASGTATLEAALFKRPMVIAYNMNAISWQLMKRKKLQPWVGLPNILCQDFVVPELLQNQATPQALAAQVLQWLGDVSSNSLRVQQLHQRFAQLHQTLSCDTKALALQALEPWLAKAG
jgi:lipid-A-disaccharide synthase